MEPVVFVKLVLDKRRCQFIDVAVGCSMAIRVGGDQLKPPGLPSGCLTVLGEGRNRSLPRHRTCHKPRLKRRDPRRQLVQAHVLPPYTSLLSRGLYGGLIRLHLPFTSSNAVLRLRSGDTLLAPGFGPPLPGLWILKFLSMPMPCLLPGCGSVTYDPASTVECPGPPCHRHGCTPCPPLPCSLPLIDLLPNTEHLKVTQQFDVPGLGIGLVKRRGTWGWARSPSVA